MIKKQRNFSDVLGKMQGGINWKVLENGIELEVDISLLENIKGYAPKWKRLTLIVGADKLEIRKLVDKGEKVKVLIRFER